MIYERARKWTVWSYVLSIGLLLVAGIPTFVLHVRQMKADTESVFAHRSELLKKFVARHQDHVTAMRSVLLDRYLSLKPADYGEFKLRRRAGNPSWELDAGALQIEGAVTGVSPLPLGGEIRRQLRSALALKTQMHSPHAADEEDVWSYFLSANGFLFMASHTPFEAALFSPELYGRRNWLQAMPEANAQRRIIMAGPYQDAAGRWILSMAAPVYAGDRLLGIVAEDTRVESLARLTEIGHVLGESLLISENGRVMARPGGGVDAKLHIRPPLADRLTDWREDASSDLWLSSAIVKDELWLVHRVRRAELYWAAAQESAGIWLMLALLGMVVFLAIRYTRDERELRALNELKNRFIGIAAHDLRNPLTAVRGMSELLLETDLEASQREELLREVNQAANAMLTLVNDLLDVAVIESGKLELRLRAADFAGLVQSRVRLIQPAAQRKGVTVTLDLPGKLTAVFDADRCGELVDNLLSNAVKFTPPNSHVHVRASEHGDDIVLAVRDEGPGIAAEDRAKLFGTFQKLKARPTAGESSTGLGLAIVKKIVEVHHGRIDVINLPAGGAEFSVWLPKENTA